ncbi:dioxygenase family protein [Geodermatophilus sp. URMC 62]|uniref:dioxygenase family protein n=1 Tax=Geodermatophilus sp. URMC 62 TaxID=3423414 RepID=UPI00406C8258
MSGGLDRRRLLGAGGVLTLAALLDACTGTGSGTGAPGATPSGSPSSAPPATTPPAPPAPSAVDLLSDEAACVLTPDTIAGPTWFDAHAVRSDVRDGRPGVPLDLAFRVIRLPACAPVPGAVVDLWQCDALGVYSGFAGAEPGQGGSPGGTDEYGDAQAAATEGTAFLRGTQVTGPDGVVTFATVYPGWYPTRTVHLHLKVHLDRSTVLTTQLFFDDAVTDAVHGGADPYRRHPGRDTRNDTDAFYTDAALLRTAPDGDRWLAALTLGVV